MHAGTPGWQKSNLQVSRYCALSQYIIEFRLPRSKFNVFEACFDRFKYFKLILFFIFIQVASDTADPASWVWWVVVVKSRHQKCSGKATRDQQCYGGLREYASVTERYDWIWRTDRLHYRIALWSLYGYSMDSKSKRWGKICRIR